MHCNWAESTRGIPKSQWVYPTRLEQIADGTTMRKDYLQRPAIDCVPKPNGNTLPGQVQPPRHFRQQRPDVARYACNSRTHHVARATGRSNDRSEPGQQRAQAERFRFVRYYGNVWEWCRIYCGPYQANDLDRLSIAQRVSLVTAPSGSVPVRRRTSLRGGYAGSGRDTKTCFRCCVAIM